MLNAPPETILQFGTGKFLRCFADLFVHEMNQSGPPAGRVVALQSTGSDRARLLSRQAGQYHVAIHGLQQGERVDRIVVTVHGGSGKREGEGCFLK